MKNSLMQMFIFGCYFLCLNSPAVEATWEDGYVSYDDVRETGGFSSAQLARAVSLKPSGPQLTNEERTQLFRSQYLSGLHTLSLKGQGMEDDFIAELCQNKSLRRIMNIDLSDNANITIKAIKNIIESDDLGSLRHLPQISGRYGTAATTIYVNAKGTRVVDPENKDNKESFTLERLYDFDIDYVNSITGKKTANSDKGAIKFVEVEK